MRLTGQRLRESIHAIDGQFLLFLVLLCNVKLVVKAAALLLLLWRHRSALREITRLRANPALLYPALMLTGIVGALAAGRFAESNYIYVFLAANSVWLCCFILAATMWREAVIAERERLMRTFEVFLLLNAFVSLLQLAAIVVETGALNPYRYQGNYQKYFINTGDYIKGISFDTSTTNAVLCAIGVLLFVQQQRWLVVAACLATLSITGSNLVNALTILGMLWLFCFRSDRGQKSVLVLCLLPFILFWARISPQNTTYIEKMFGKAKTEQSREPILVAGSASADDERTAFAQRWIDSMGKKKTESEPAALLQPQVRPELPKDNIHSDSFQHRDDTGGRRRELVLAAQQLGTTTKTQLDTRPGKIVAMTQTLHWLKLHPALAIAGSGPGTFSSKMAFKATGLGIAGQFPKGLTYQSADFKDNHLALFLSFFAAPEKMHSVVHTPNSVYDQVVSEYGLIGLALLAAWGMWFLAKRRQLGYTLPLLGLLAALLATDYWFEQVSLVPVFELLFFFEIRNHER